MKRKSIVGLMLAASLCCMSCGGKRAASPREAVGGTYFARYLDEQGGFDGS